MSRRPDHGREASGAQGEAGAAEEGWGPSPKSAKNYAKEPLRHQSEAKKIVIQKFRRRKNMRRKNGHSQPYTVVQIISLDLPV